MNSKSNFAHSLSKIFRYAAYSIIAVVVSCYLFPAVTGQSKQGTVERIKVHGKSLEGNLSGDS
ncbi:MAG TPA: hypothetical protein VEF04_08585, partial [Blastocatellia bacterium]|nr:hypothetical protein [Blastocatellia bacterium]